MSKEIPINKPVVGEEEAKLVREIVLTGMFTTWSPSGGKWVRTFEESFARYVGVRHAVAVNSGTSALHASLIAAEVGPGDEVIVPPFTFPSTSDVVLLVGAKPVFTDINIRTYNIDPTKLASKVTSKTKAIIPVHLYGLSADMKSIMELAREKDITVIEDACQSHGSEYREMKTGSLGDMGCFSFYPSKIITTGEGGMVTTNSDRLAERLRLIRTHGHSIEYRTDLLGTNFRMPELEAAMGYVQLGKIESFLAKRRRNAEILAKRLQIHEEIILPYEPEGYRHNWYVYTIRMKRAERRKEVMSRLEKMGVGVKVYYPYPTHKTPYYVRMGYGTESLPMSEMAANSVFSLPTHPNVTDEDAEYIADAVKRALSET